MASVEAKEATVTEEVQLVLAVSGWRGLSGCDARKVVFDALTEFAIRNGKPHVIVTGGARGADQIAEEWARRKGIHVVTLRPRRTKGMTYEEARKECLARNTDIVKRCTHLLAFPSDEGSGTQDAIHKALALGKPVKVVKV